MPGRTQSLPLISRLRRQLPPEGGKPFRVSPPHPPATSLPCGRVRKNGEADMETSRLRGGEMERARSDAVDLLKKQCYNTMSQYILAHCRRTLDGALVCGFQISGGTLNCWTARAARSWSAGETISSCGRTRRRSGIRRAPTRAGGGRPASTAAANPAAEAGTSAPSRRAGTCTTAS